jgi:hypothetical protein
MHPLGGLPTHRGYQRVIFNELAYPLAREPITANPTSCQEGEKWGTQTSGGTPRDYGLTVKVA